MLIFAVLRILRGRGTITSPSEDFAKFLVRVDDFSEDFSIEQCGFGWGVDLALRVLLTVWAVPRRADPCDVMTPTRCFPFRHDEQHRSDLQEGC